MQKYPYAVMDGNAAPDQFRFAASCHKSKKAACRQRDKLNRCDPNYHYYVVLWDASRWAQLRPNDKHYADE
jgi:hypothetical protein